MGLDGVEIVMAAEDSFGVDLPDDEVSKVKTVGDFYDLVTTKLQDRASSICLTSNAFYRTRRAIMDAIGVDRRDIRPSTHVLDLLAGRGVVTTWRQVERSIRLRIPKLAHPNLVTLAIVAVSILLTAYTLSIVSTWIGQWVYLGSLFLWVGFVLALYSISAPLANQLPAPAYSVGDLARDVLALNHRQIADDIGSWNADEAWETICRLVVNQTGVARENITRDATFVEDLGID